MAPTYEFLYLFTCCCVVCLWEKHPGPVPATQTKWAKFEASAVGDTSAVVLATREMFAHVCSRKIIGLSHASDFVATTKVRIQLRSPLNRCLGQSIQRGYNRWAKGHKHPPVGQSELTATNAPVGRSVHWMPCVFSFGAGWGSSQSISFCC